VGVVTWQLGAAVTWWMEEVGVVTWGAGVGKLGMYSPHSSPGM